MGLPQYQGENKQNLPPVLTSEGARVNPDWLKGFLANPSLSTTDMNRNGVRTYLQVRMPTFFLSDDEIRTLVLFFEAMSSQPQPFIPQKLEPLTTAEKEMARELFTSTAAPCLKCHATGDPAHDKNAIAPNFLFAKERLQPAWTERWITNPALIAPGTAMPSGLFKRDGDHWVFSGPLPASFNGYTGDHADLLVRYMFELTPEEQRALMGRTPPAAARAEQGSRQLRCCTGLQATFAELSSILYRLEEELFREEKQDWECTRWQSERSLWRSPVAAAARPNQRKARPLRPPARRPEKRSTPPRPAKSPARSSSTAPRRK